MEQIYNLNPNPSQTQILPSSFVNKFLNSSLQFVLK